MCRLNIVLCEHYIVSSYNYSKKLSDDNPWRGHVYIFPVQIIKIRITIGV